MQKYFLIIIHEMVSIGGEYRIDGNDYGYFCEPDKLNTEHTQRIRINNQNKIVSYCSTNNLFNTMPSTIIEFENELDYEYIDPKSNKYFLERVNKYTDAFITGCVVVITITITSALVKYNII